MRLPHETCTSYAYVIFQSNVVLKGTNGGADFETPEEGTPKGEELARKRMLLTDSDEDEDSSENDEE